MAITINGTYAGELALPYIHAALLSGDTLAKGYVTLKEGVKYKAVLKKLSSANLVQSFTCDFSDPTDLTLNESVLGLRLVALQERLLLLLLLHNLLRLLQVHTLMI